MLGVSRLIVLSFTLGVPALRTFGVGAAFGVDVAKSLGHPYRALGGIGALARTLGLGGRRDHAVLHLRIED